MLCGGGEVPVDTVALFTSFSVLSRIVSTFFVADLSCSEADCFDSGCTFSDTSSCVEVSTVTAFVLESCEVSRGASLSGCLTGDVPLEMCCVFVSSLAVVWAVLDSSDFCTGWGVSGTFEGSCSVAVVSTKQSNLTVRLKETNVDFKAVSYLRFMKLV